MTQLQDRFSLTNREVTGDPLTIMGRVITPIIRVTKGKVMGVDVKMRRPVGIEVVRESEVKKYVIPPATRRAMIIAAVAGGTLVASGISLALYFSQRKRA